MIPEYRNKIQYAPDTLDDISSENWQEAAACKDEDPELFFPEKTPNEAEKTATAKKICGSCAVREVCYKSAMSRFTTNGRDPGGIWGGSTKKQRRVFRKRRKERAAKEAERVSEGAKLESTAA